MEFKILILENIKLTKIFISDKIPLIINVTGVYIYTERMKICILQMKKDMKK